MFHEFRDLITELKQSDNHFARLFDEHNALDDEIKRLETGATGVTQYDEIEQKKRQKLKLKDEIYTILRTKSAE